jgi:hypothetical protein
MRGGPAGTKSLARSSPTASATRAPSAASIMARPAPIPDEAPVTTATRPVNAAISRSCLAAETKDRA